MKHAVDEDHVKHPRFEGQFLRRCCRHMKALRYLPGQFWIRFHAIEAAEPLTRPLYEVSSGSAADVKNRRVFICNEIIEPLVRAS